MRCPKDDLELFRYGDGVVSCKNGHRWNEDQVPESRERRPVLSEYTPPGPEGRGVHPALVGGLAGLVVVGVDVLVRAVT